MALKAWQLVALATALAFGLAWHQLGHESFLPDEFTTRRWALLPFAEIWETTAEHYHPPLYFWFMHGWLRVGASPPDEAWLRFPSAFFFALTVPVAYLLGRTLTQSRRTGVYAAFLVATFPFLLHYGQEARSYAMLTFFAACGFAAVARIMCGYREEARPRFLGVGLVRAGRRLARGDFRLSRRALGDDGAWVVYIVSSVTVMGLHHTAGIYPAVTGFILVCAIGVAPSFRSVRFVNLCIATALIALVYSPQIPHLLSGVERVTLPYLTAPDVGRVLWIFPRVYGGSWGMWGILLLTPLTVLVLVAMVTWARSRRWERVAFTLIGWLLAPMLLVAFSFWKPIVLPKLLIWTLIPFLVGSAAGFALVPRILARAAILAVLLALNLGGVAREWEFVRHDWKGLSRSLAREAAPGAAALICPPWWQTNFGHYWKEEKRAGLRFHVVDVFHDRGRVLEIADRRAGDRWGPEVSPAGLLAKHPEVWLIWHPPRCGGRMNFLTRPLEESGQLIKTGRFGDLRLSVYEKNK